MKSIAIIIPYYGQWPSWIDLFFVSCKNNDTIDFHFFTDLSIPDVASNERNIRFHQISFVDYCTYASRQLGIDFHPVNPYKLCDLRPFYGFIHQNILKDYDFWGYGDIDLIWGNIRHFYNDKILSMHDILSTHADRFSGHLTLVHNLSYINNRAFDIPNWQSLLIDNKNYALDEQHFTLQFYPTVRFLWKIHRHIYFRFKFKDEWKSYNSFCKVFNKLFGPRRLYLVEQYTTPWFTEYETDSIVHWTYRNGMINESITGKELIYLHFLSLKTHWCNKYLHISAPFDDITITLKGIFDTKAIN